MKITYEGAEYDFDLLKVGVEELREIKRKLGLTVAKFLAGMAEADVDCMVATKWLVLRSDGQHDDLVLNANDPMPDYWDFVRAWNKAEEEDEGAEEDPTQAGSLPATSIPESNGSSTPTSESSPTSTVSPSPGTAESPNGTSDGSLSAASSPTSSA